MVKEFYCQLQSSDQRIQNAPNKYHHFNFSCHNFLGSRWILQNYITIPSQDSDKKSRLNFENQLNLITLYWSFLSFQVLARFMALLNLVLPIFSILFIQTGDSYSLNICLGKGHLNFLTPQAQFCSADNPYKNCVCWVWLTILSIGNSKFQINKLAWIKL